MPIPLDAAAAKTLAPRFDEALELIRNEFDGLDTHRQYQNAFARLLKADPLHRVRMMGTDQRDMFVPELRQALVANIPKRGGHILDLGAGDGQTFALAADVVPESTRVSIAEPNPAYVADYQEYLSSQMHLLPGMALAAGFEDLDAAARRTGAALPPDGSVDVVLAMHMIYFLEDLPRDLCKMLRFLRPGGVLFSVMADESTGYTGQALKAYVEQRGDTGAPTRHLATIAERHRLVASAESGGGALADVARDAGLPVAFEAHRQPSRLYGHTLCDMIALSIITALAEVDSMEKFEIAAELLRTRPESVDLRIEDEGPRKGMWSVTQPQWITVVRRLP